VRNRFISALSITGALALTGCTAATVGGRDAAFISNPQEEIYVEIPKTWKQFTVNPYNDETDRLDGIARNTGWSRMADASPAPSERHADAQFPPHPVLVMSVSPLSTDWRTEGTGFRDNLSLARLRAEVYGAVGLELDDPIDAFKGGDPSIEVISYSDKFEGGRTWGGHIRANLRIIRDEQDASKDQWTTVDSWALVDYRQSKLYTLTVKCEASCFRKRKGEIDTVVNSFRVRGENVPPFTPADALGARPTDSSSKKATTT
jgi:hypothetical protein